MKEDIPANILSTENVPLESLYIELNLRNTKWLLNCSYYPHTNIIEQDLAALGDYLDLHSSNYEKILILEDFNVSFKENDLNRFCENYSPKTLRKKPYML